MIIYRGPKTKTVRDPLTHRVDRRDLSTATWPWLGMTEPFEVNITKDSPYSHERESVAYIKIEEADIVALHEGLVKGWQAKILELNENLNLVEEDLASLKDALEKIQSKVRYAKHINNEGALDWIDAIAEDALLKCRK